MAFRCKMKTTQRHWISMQINWQKSRYSDTKLHTFHIATRTFFARGKTMKRRRKKRLWMGFCSSTVFHHSLCYCMHCTRDSNDGLCEWFVRICPLEIRHWTAMHLSTHKQTEMKSLPKHAECLRLWLYFLSNARACENYCCLLMTDALMWYTSAPNNV